MNDIQAVEVAEAAVKLTADDAVAFINDNVENEDDRARPVIRYASSSSSHSPWSPV